MNHLATTNGVRCCVAVLAIVGASAATVPARAADWRITQLAMRGTVASTPQTAASLDVAQGAAGAWQARRLMVNDTLADGARIRVPAHVELRVSSEQAVHVRHDYGSEGELELKLSAPNRNAFAVLAGQWLFKVEKRLDTVSVSAGRGQALSRNTAFAIAVDPVSKVATFRVDEGDIDVWTEMTLQVADRTLGSTPVRRSLKAGDPALVLTDTADDYLFRYGSFDDAAAAFEARWRAAVDQRNINGQFNALVALGDVLRAAGRGPEALARFEQALALAQDPAEGYWRAMLHGRQGDALAAQNRYAAAAEAYRRSMAEHAMLVPREGEDAVTDQRINLAGVYRADGTYRCAESQASSVMSALNMRSATRFHPSRATMWVVRADAAAGTGRVPAALVAYRSAIDLWRVLGAPTASAQPDRQVVTEPLAAALVGQGQAQIAARRLGEAEASLREARIISERLFTGPHGLQADARLAQAELMAARGQRKAALAEVEAVLALLAAAPPDNLRQGDAHQVRGLLLLSLNDAAGAHDALARARALWQQSWPQDDHPRFAALAPKLAQALRARGAEGDEARARAVLDAAREGQRLLAQREQACLR